VYRSVLQFVPVCSTQDEIAETRCSTLQHTATHFNALNRTATHCNTLQHTATHCNTLQLQYLNRETNKVIECQEQMETLQDDVQQLNGGPFGDEAPNDRGLATLQTHRNTLQHTATCPATHCTATCLATHCCTLHTQHTTAHCNMPCNTLLHTTHATHCSTVQHALQDTALQHALQHTHTAAHTALQHALLQHALQHTATCLATHCYTLVDNQLTMS